MPPLTDTYTGADGAILIAGFDSSAEGRDAVAITDLEIYSLSEVGRAQGIEVHVDTDLQEFHEVGRRHPTQLHPGNIHIYGTIDRAYINGALLYLLLGRGAHPNLQNEPYVQPSFQLHVVLKNPASAAPGHRSVLTLHEVKFENWGFRMPEDTFVLEKVRFRALRVDVREDVGSTATPPTFPEVAA